MKEKDNRYFKTVQNKDSLGGREKERERGRERDKEREGMSKEREGKGNEE